MTTKKLERLFNYAFQNTHDIHTAMAVVNEHFPSKPLTYEAFLEMVRRVTLQEQCLYKNDPMNYFDWVKAAKMIKKYKAEEAYAGLEGDWNSTCGTIFENGKPNLEHGAYLCSNWATPTLAIPMGDGELRIECTTDIDQGNWPEEAKNLVR